MKYAFFVIPIIAAATAATAANLAPAGTGIMGSNDATITDPGTSHAQAGSPANIRDGNPATRVDNYQPGQPGNINGYAGVRWAAPRTEAVKSITLTLATFPDGGWFGNRECPLPGQPLTRAMLAAPVAQVSTSSTLATWATVPATTNYLSALTGHVIAADSVPSSRSFTLTLAQAQTGIYGIRVLGPTGGYGDGNGFLGVFEMAVEGEAFPDTDTDGMDDAWEAARGLTVGANDAALDAPDADGLTNEQEFRWSTNPQVTDSDGDGLSDGSEANTHNTFPSAADTDGDGLSDGAEISTHLTDPARADSDGDGLTDGAEVTAHLTSPTIRDHDGDGFSDGREIALGTNPTSAASRPANIALAAQAILGRNAGTSAAQLAVTGTPRVNAGTTANVNDGPPVTLAHTRDMTGSASHAGLVWDAPWPQPVARMEITFATFGDGGWFGTGNPGPGGALIASALTAPALQTTTNGADWVTLAPSDYTTDYVTRLTGHSIGGGARPEVTRRAAIFTLNTPAASLRGLRVAGAHRIFLSIAEIAATDTTTPDDTDGDGLTNADETARGAAIDYSDSDEDGLTDGAEVSTHLTNPLVADSDGDGFGDGLEVLGGSNPASASSTGNLATLATGLMGVNDALDTDAGTPLFHAGAAANITDGNLTTRVDSWNSSSPGAFSFVGLRWASPRSVNVLRVRFATFINGGWFGPTNTGPAGGGALIPGHLVEPAVQISTNGGTTWTTVPHASDYLSIMPGHTIGGGSNPPATLSPAATFTLTTPAANVDAIRLIGREGGSAEGFIGVFDVAAWLSDTSDPDSDDDGLPDAWEITKLGSITAQAAADDLDFDGSNALMEYAFDLSPNAFDAPPAPVVEAGYLTMTVTKRPRIGFNIVSGSTLMDFAGTDTTTLINDGTTLKVRDNFPITGPAPRRYMRTIITPAP